MIKTRDGQLSKRRPDDAEEAWPVTPVASMSEADIEAAAVGDRDNPPLTPERQAQLRPVPRVKTLRRALGLTQEEFRGALIIFLWERCGIGNRGALNPINRPEPFWPLSPAPRRKWRNSSSNAQPAIRRAVLAELRRLRALFLLRIQQKLPPCLHEPS